MKDGIVYYREVALEAKEMFDLFPTMNVDCPNEPYVMHLKPDFNKES